MSGEMKEEKRNRSNRAPLRRVSNPGNKESDLLVFCHLRWDFVFQRPQHILSRLAKTRRVFYIEEPIFTSDPQTTPRLEFANRENGVVVCTPILPPGLTEAESWAFQKSLIDGLLKAEKVSRFTAWYYTPMALPFTQHLKPECVVYDCMDELSLFKGAHPSLLEFESQLFRLADVVFTGGQSLFEAKRSLHDNVHAFPSSIDAAHFREARVAAEAEDQKQISGKKLGFFGVIDERMDIELLDGVAKLRPDWNLMIIGPVVKIDPASLPKHANIHYLGKRDYKELPQYIAGWDLAFLPFARNNSTRMISPTKTPEYLAAGRPVVSTPIRDVIRPYAHEKLVHIASTPEQFVEAAEQAMREAAGGDWLSRVDAFLASMSWDKTVGAMAGLELQARQARLRVNSMLQAVVQDYSTPMGA